MTAREYVELYKGHKVRVKPESIGKIGIPHYKSWVGKIIGLSGGEGTCICETIERASNGLDRVGRQSSWSPYHLEVIDEELSFSIPENHRPCPKCKSLECKGLDRLDCISGR